MDVQYQTHDGIGKSAPPAAPYDGCGRQLWSLWDMLRVYAASYIALGEALKDLSVAYSVADADHPVTDDEKQELKNVLANLKHHCDSMQYLPVSSALLKDAIEDLPETGREINILANSVKKEIGAQLFLFVPPHRAKFHEAQSILNGQIRAKFPEASKELVSAGNAFACGLYTACVFHCMRAAEIGLRALAKHLGVALHHPLESAEWQTLIGQIDLKLAALRNTPKTAARDEEVRFYADANAQFFNFKEAFRKYVAHARDSYGEGDGIGILENTFRFLERLADRVAE